jgi:hypothetical protein
VFGNRHGKAKIDLGTLEISKTTVSPGNGGMLLYTTNAVGADDLGRLDVLSWTRAISS